jgi:creatinine amidohydrolase
MTQIRALAPNVAVLPWGSTEAHGYHLPHGTDTIEATAISEAAVAGANARGARCALLPTMPFGNTNLQLDQCITITMRSATQSLVLRDVADSLVRQGIDRLVVMNFHGGNDFRAMIRDIVLDFPIFVIQVNGWEVAPFRELLEDPSDNHAGEFETSLMLHLSAAWVAPRETYGDGKATPFALPSLASGGVWCPRKWSALTHDTGVGNPRAATAAKGREIFDRLVRGIEKVLVELSLAKEGDFPYVIGYPPHKGDGKGILP